ncbi:hypothetical protein [Lentibacillus saliphilus]|uniref:hypothetical protein n=1 Tax=Lentibacillus saliphilus TaxID=2737028 RepID=UPI001C302B27|nr:hypothetical protein [Lentibacillus saliphilus]
MMMISIGILMGMIYKWRYRLLNVVLAVGLIRRLAVKVTLNLPQFRKKMIPALFERPQS